MEVIEIVRELLEPMAEERGYFIVDITYRREAGKFVLRVLADKKGGITMDECAWLNNELSQLLDSEDIIKDQYILEVSSPGLDRKLEKDSDFIWAVGRRVKIKTYVPIDRKNVFVGTLLGLGEGTIVLEEDGVSTEIPREKIASARLYTSAGLYRGKP